MHWLAGSKIESSINKLWRHVGALDDSVKIHYSEPFMEFSHLGIPIRLYRDVDRTEKEWLELSPTDAKEIKAFCNNIRKVKGLAMPVEDIKGVKVTKKSRPPLSLLFKVIKVVGVIRKYSKVTAEAYAKCFKHIGLQELFMSFPKENEAIVPLFMTLGFLADGDGGFPEGGSLPFVDRMVKTHESLGGKLLLNTRALKVIMENGKAIAVDVKLKSEEIQRIDADAVIIATHTMKIQQFFDVVPQSKWLDKMYNKTEPTSATLVSLGIDANLNSYPERPIFKLNTPICFADKKFTSIFVNNYANDRTYSPAGKTAMTIQLAGDTYHFWKTAKETGTYQEVKEKLGKAVVNELTKLIPEIEGKVEIVDIATPVTYERYCDNWKGSWMTEMKGNIASYPPEIKGLGGVYFSGHRMMPPGGLPPALMSARKAVQCLCRDTGTLFISE
jgi:phytoene dehydrogenase-like protein